VKHSHHIDGGWDFIMKDAHNAAWGFSLLSFMCGGNLWNCKTSSSDVDVICFHIGTNFEYANEEAKLFVDNWCTQKKKQKGSGIQHLLKLRYCQPICKPCVDLLEHIFVPEEKRISIEEGLKHPFFNIEDTLKKVL